MHSIQKCVTNNIRVQDNWDLNKPNCTPTKRWRKFIFMVNYFEDEARHVLVKLQGLNTLFWQQHAHILDITNINCHMNGMRGPISCDIEAV